jgi:NAD dependent epimerase/dehydratase family enzyme
VWYVFEAILNPTMEGAYNAAILDDTTNNIFSKTLARIYGYSIWLPNVPAFILKLVMAKWAAIV